MTELTKSTIIPFLDGIFTRRGADEYLGEPVTIGEHMLQAAHFARRDGHEEQVIFARASLAISIPCPRPRCTR